MANNTIMQVLFKNGNNNTAELLSQVSTNGPNYLYFWQNGNDNTLTAEQLISDDGTVNGLNYSEGEQNGIGNNATLLQDGYLNRSLLRQDGSYNTTTLTQKKDGTPSTLVDNYAENRQVGDFNDYTLVQEGNLNYQQLWQNGDNNEAWIDQFAIASNNISNIFQNGNNNVADLDQLTEHIPTAPNTDATNVSMAEQNGGNNMLKVRQIGEYAENTSDVMQRGDYNDAYLFQKTWYNNTSTNTVSGTGDFNYLKVEQFGWGGRNPLW